MEGRGHTADGTTPRPHPPGRSRRIDHILRWFYLRRLHQTRALTSHSAPEEILYLKIYECSTCMQSARQRRGQAATMQMSPCKARATHGNLPLQLARCGHVSIDRRSTAVELRDA